MPTQTRHLELTVIVEVIPEINGTLHGGYALNDVGLVLGGVASMSIRPTINQAEELASRYNISMVTGHSLGGYVAEIIATNRGIAGASFCGPGVNGPVVKFGGSVTPGFQNIQFEHDLIGNFNCAVYTHVQWSVYVATPGGSPCHSIDEMVKYFKGKQHITNRNVVDKSSSYPTGYYYPK